jgi:hypothetical protein
MTAILGQRLSVGFRKENNHRAHREHRESFSAIVSFFSKPSEKHECFSEGLLKKEKPGGETAG